MFYFKSIGIDEDTMLIFLKTSYQIINNPVVTEMNYNLGGFLDTKKYSYKNLTWFNSIIALKQYSF